MLRVGLTGELGSGKSTVARLLAERGAIILSSDEMGRATMQPGHGVYNAIVDQFGPSVLLPEGQLNRPELARLAFDPEHPRIEELNALVHPAVLAEQEQLIAEIALTQPNAVVVVESALIFSATYAAGNEPWRKRFDRIVVVTAPDDVKLARVVARTAWGRAITEDERAALIRDAQARTHAQRLPTGTLAADCMFLDNSADLSALTIAVDRLWQELNRPLS